MRLLLIALLVLLSTSYSAHAVFSAHELVKDSEKQPGGEFSPIVTIERVKDGPYIVHLSNLNKNAWLIRTKKALANDMLNFRQHIWKEKTRKDIANVQIIYDRSTEFHSRNLGKASTTVTDLNNYYIYIDSPIPIEDGGFYYTFDLAAIYSHQIHSGIK